MFIMASKSKMSYYDEQIKRDATITTASTQSKLKFLNNLSGKVSDIRNTDYTSFFNKYYGRDKEKGING
jgi:hypothetical protein